MDNKNLRIVIGIVVGVCLIAALYFFTAGRGKSIRPAGRVDVDSGYRLVMGTLARVVAVAADSGTANACIKSAFVEIEKIDELMSSYKSDSEISEINRDGFNRAVKVSEPTYEVLQKSIEFSKFSGGAFDITVGPLVDLWQRAVEANSVPTDDEMAQARSKVGYEKLLLDANEMSVRFAVDGMRLDMGGIAKGYAIDKAVEAMQKSGAIGGMVDIGGDIRCFGAPPEGKDKWLIGLQDPRKTEGDVGVGKPLLVLKLGSAAIATSGSYRRFALIGGKKYSHILDSQTGQSSDKLASVTVISKNAIDADALATVVSVIGTERGLALIEAEPEAEAILILLQPQYKLIKTSGAEKYRK